MGHEHVVEDQIMRRSYFTMMAVCAIVSLTGALPVYASCQDDVAKAFAKQRDKSAYRMKTRQFSERGLVFMTVDYLLPYKMHQTVKSATSSDVRQLILVGTKAWVTAGLGWSLISKKDTASLNKQFGASVLNPPKDKLKYECLGQLEIEGRTLIAYQGKQGNSENARTETTVLRTVYIDPETGLPVRTTVARASKPDLAFFKADYSYPDDIVIEPPKDVKPSPATTDNGKQAPLQSKAKRPK